MKGAGTQGPVVGELSFIYTCSNGDFLSGDINREGAVWTALRAEAGLREIHDVDIVVAWY